MSKPARVALLVLCAFLLAPWPAVAQDSGYYLRVAPEFAWTTVEHTKKVAVDGGSSTSTSSTTGSELSAHLAGGFRGQPVANWYLSVELEAIIYSPRTLTADIQPVSAGRPHDIWPGRWEYTNKGGFGSNIVLERSLGSGGLRALAFAGIHRIESEVATGGENPGTGNFDEERAVRNRYPFTGGIGAVMGPIQARLSYFRSLVYLGLHSPEINFDYEWQASGLVLNLGVEFF